MRIEYFLSGPESGRLNVFFMIFFRIWNLKLAEKEFYFFKRLRFLKNLYHEEFKGYLILIKNFETYETFFFEDQIRMFHRFRNFLLSV